MADTVKDGERMAQAAEQGLTSWQQQVNMARVLHQSGFVPKNVKSPEQALAIMQMGKEVGVGPMAALQKIYYIETKDSSGFSMAPELALALVRRSGLLEDMTIEDQDGACTVTLKRKNQPHPVKKTFTREQARKANLSGKFNWSGYESQMLYQRALGFAIDALFSDITWGLPNPDELGAITKQNGTPDIQDGYLPTQESEAIIETVAEEGALPDPQEAPVPAQPPVKEFTPKQQRLINLWQRMWKVGFPTIPQDMRRTYLIQSFGEKAKETQSLSEDELNFWEGQLKLTEEKSMTWEQMLESSRYAQDGREDAKKVPPIASRTHDVPASGPTTPSESAEAMDIPFTVEKPKTIPNEVPGLTVEQVKAGWTYDGEGRMVPPAAVSAPAPATVTTPKPRKRQVNL